MKCETRIMDRHFKKFILKKCSLSLNSNFSQLDWWMVEFSIELGLGYHNPNHNPNW